MESRVNGYKIRSKSRVGRWRCGMWHGPEWVFHDGALFTAEQVKRLKADPMLMVQTMDIPEPAGGQVNDLPPAQLEPEPESGEPAETVSDEPDPAPVVADPVTEKPTPVSVVADLATEKPKARKGKKVA